MTTPKPITFASLEDLAAALREVERPVIETHGVDGPAVVIYDLGENAPPPQIQPNSWIQVEPDYETWAKLLAEWTIDSR